MSVTASAGSVGLHLRGANTVVYVDRLPAVPEQRIARADRQEVVVGRCVTSDRDVVVDLWAGTGKLEPMIGMASGAYREHDPVLAAIVDRLIRQFRPRQIYLFGSRARGNARPDSDYDVLVVAESGLAGYKRMALARKAVGFVGSGCDIFVYTPQEFDKHRTMLGDVARTAAEQGVVLYDEAA